MIPTVDCVFPSPSLFLCHCWIRTFHFHSSGFIFKDKKKARVLKKGLKEFTGFKRYLKRVPLSKEFILRLLYFPGTPIEMWLQPSAAWGDHIRSHCPLPLRVCITDDHPSLALELQDSRVISCHEKGIC